MVMVKPALAYLDVIAADPRRVRRSGRGVPRERRVRDGEGRRAARLDRRHRGRARAPARDQARRRRHHAHLLRPRGRRARSRRTREPSWFARAQARIPGGVNSPVRAFGSVGGDPFFVARAHGAYLVDTDGREYLDYVQSWGASILGHAHPDGRRGGAARRGRRHVVRRADARARSSSPRRSARACPSVEKVRLVSSGTEAAMTAVRLARGATGRAKIVKFAGCYHGHARRAAGAGRAAVSRRSGCPGSAGVTPGTVADTIVVPYNDLAALDARARRARRRRRGDPRRADRREHGPRAARRRLPRRPARALHPHRRAARVRRGDHRLSRRRRRRAGAVRGSRPICRSSARSSAAGSRSRRSAARRR